MLVHKRVQFLVMRVWRAKKNAVLLSSKILTMQLKNSRLAKKIFLGGILFATVFAVGCNNSEEKKESETPVMAPATEVAPATTTPPDTTIRKDTASIRPTKTPN